MNSIFKNAKVEITGLIAWALLSFGVINISMQLFRNSLLSIFLSTVICCLLNAFFQLSFYAFKLRYGRLFLFSMLYAMLVIAYQFSFNSFIRLHENMLGIGGYLFMACSLVFFNMTFGTILKLMVHVKR